MERVKAEVLDFGTRCGQKVAGNRREDSVSFTKS